LTGGSGGDSNPPKLREIADNYPNTSDKPDDEKTIEELLADLGPSEQWDVTKSEHDQVEDLLKQATLALKNQPALETIPGEGEEAAQPSHARLPAVDVSVFAPEPESDGEEETKPTKTQLRDGINQEADDVLKRLMDEVNYERRHGTQSTEQRQRSSESEDDEDSNENDAEPLNLPTAPSRELESNAQPIDEALAARFANLSLPSVPTTIKPASGLPSKPKADSNKFTDEEIDSWCIICSDDATLSCLGCDGDLYCMNCWLEGHRGEDAGEEEKRHKAVQYVKGGRKKMVRQKRVMLGA
jgi:hypothetical protein